MKKSTVFLFLLGWFLLAKGLMAQNVAVTDDEGYTAHYLGMLDIQPSTKSLLIPYFLNSDRFYQKSSAVMSY